MIRNIKRLIKRANIELLSERVSEHALRLVYLSRFVKWCKRHPVRHISSARGDVHKAVITAIGDSTRIDYLEFGVFRGESLGWWLDGNSNSHSRFVGFDSFLGLPEDWTSDVGRGAFNLGGALPSVNDARCRFIAGWFQDTVGPFICTFERNGRLVVHLDADLFSSTLLVLFQIASLFKEGDVLIFDEFHDYLDEYRAFECFLKAYPMTLETLAATPGYDGFGYSQVAFGITKIHVIGEDAASG